MRSLNIEKVTDLIKEVSEEVILPYFNSLAPSQIDHKDGDSTNLVTIADRESEKALSRGLKQMYPGSSVIGEELVHESPKELLRLQEEEPVWIIDPIDGTSAFVEKDEHFYVLLALVQKNEILAGWIYSPVQKHLAISERGSGAWLNDARIILPPAPSAEDCTCVFYPAYFPDEVTRLLEANSQDNGVNLISEGYCCGYDYLSLLKGNYHVTQYHSMHPWDHCSGTLLYNEAGGVSLQLDGKPYLPTHSTGGLLHAPTQKCWDEIKELLYSPRS